MSAAAMNEMERLKAKLERHIQLYSANWDEDRLCAMLSVLDESTATSLAKRDLIKQAEALEEFGNKFGPESIVRAHSKEVATELRQQAAAL